MDKMYQSQRGDYQFCHEGLLGKRKANDGDVSKPRGTSTAYSYFVKCYRDQQKQLSPNLKLDLADFSRECGQIWRSMSVEEKEPYRSLAIEDKQRYDEEMQYYVPNVGGGEEKKKRRRKEKKDKDPNAPKRPLTSYLWFCQDERPVIKELYPNMNGAETTKELGLRWGQLDPAIKDKYQEKYENEKARYELVKTKYDEEVKNNSIKFNEINEENL